MPTRERVLIKAFVHLSDSLIADYDPVEIAQDMVETLADVLPCTAAGVLVADHLNQLQLLAATSEQDDLLELLPVPPTEIGPSRTAFAEGRQVLLPDLAADPQRWPGFAARARARGWASAYVLPMRLRDERVGVVKVFCPTPEGLNDDDIAATQALADVATIGMLHARVLADTLTVSAQLHRALNSRILIEQAKGMLSEQTHLDMDTTFAALRAYARATGTRLVHLARAVTDRTADTDAILAHIPQPHP
ncbi:GAF and ANTAR domain-containing protein [Nocardia sp. CS682]|uniref:GAF and ANTAR domain-containing protein n=1 Tax=Nocardia sp. CS682 TaxID=1047172 RepID=UPI00142FF273|nr:GAF and ANTAR domain-containing protein [Nocardia sp. CS682]